MFSENAASFFAGAFAGLVTDLSLHPLDTVKTRLQTSTSSAAKSINTKSLAKSLFQGLTPALCGSCPSGAFFFSTYQFVSRKLENCDGNTTSSDIIYKSLIASCLGEASACLVRAPVDIVKKQHASRKIRKRITLSSLLLHKISQSLSGSLVSRTSVCDAATTNTRIIENESDCPLHRLSFEWRILEHH